VFASELKALIEFLPERRANLQLAREFLAWDILDHDQAETMIVGIKRLPPAHSMTWHPGQGMSLRRYWWLDINEECQTDETRRTALIEEFRECFQNTVSLHLRSDIPVGTCLSGGLDSSSIVCVVSAELRRRGVWREDWQHTFSACYVDPSLDERPYIQEVAASTGCRTHYVFPQGHELRQELDTWLWHQEEPVGSCGVYSQYCVARLA
jgi:asparagine synthase (glutamine-hydrolysing)